MRAVCRAAAGSGRLPGRYAATPAVFCGRHGPPPPDMPFVTPAALRRKCRLRIRWLAARSALCLLAAWSARCRWALMVEHWGCWAASRKMGWLLWPVVSLPSCLVTHLPPRTWPTAWPSRLTRRWTAARSGRAWTPSWSTTSAARCGAALMRWSRHGSVVPSTLGLRDLQTFRLLVLRCSSRARAHGTHRLHLPHPPPIPHSPLP